MLNDSHHIKNTEIGERNGVPRFFERLQPFNKDKLDYVLLLGTLEIPGIFLLTGCNGQETYARGAGGFGQIIRPLSWILI